MSVPIFVPSLSSMPLDRVVLRMLFISCCMNSASNCLDAALIAALGSAAARPRSTLAVGSRMTSLACTSLADSDADRGELSGMAMSDDLDLGVQRAGERQRPARDRHHTGIAECIGLQ